jgi:hypothetical protein
MRGQEERKRLLGRKYETPRACGVENEREEGEYRGGMQKEKIRCRFLLLLLVEVVVVVVGSRTTSCSTIHARAAMVAGSSRR